MELLSISEFVLKWDDVIDEYMAFFSTKPIAKLQFVLVMVHWVFQHGTYHKVKTCSHIKICYTIATCDTSWSNVSSWWTLTFHPGVHIYSILYGFSITTRNQTCCQYFSSSALIGLSKVHQHNEITQ